MSKVSKVIFTIISIIVIVVIVAVVAVGLFADAALKAAIESAGSKALNVKVSVEDADLSIMAGKLGLQNLVIDNLPGYQHPRLLDLQNARIAVKLRSLTSDVVRISDISLDGVKIVVEQKGLSNNLQDIIKAMSSRAESTGKAEPTGKKLHIDNLKITNVTAMVKLLPVPGKADTVTLKLSPIKMTDLGSDDKLDTAELSGRILLAIAEGVAEQGVGILPKNMVDTMKSTLDKTFDLGKATSEKGQELMNVGKELFEGLLKPKKKE